MKRRLDYDLMRVCSMIAVVYLHVVAGTLRSASGALWHFANVTTSLATAAVPLFFMLSGALLLNQAQTAELKTLPRRLAKVLTPLLVWSALVILYYGRTQGWSTALGLFNQLLGTPVMTPYWFLYALVCMYLLSPLLKRMADAMGEALWRYLLLLWVIAVIGLNTVTAFAPAPIATFFKVSYSFNLSFIGGHLGYFLLGGWLARRKTTPSRKLLWPVAAVMVILIAAGTLWACRATGTYDERFKSYTKLFALVLSVTLFLLFRSYGEKRTSGWAVTLLSGLSFGVYLAHPPAIEVLRGFWGKHWGTIPATIPGVGTFFLLVLGACLLGVFVVSSIKPLCFILTGQKFKTACRESNLFSLLQKRR